MKQVDFKGKSVLVLGLGREGLDSLRFFLANYPNNRLGVADQADFGSLGPEMIYLLRRNPTINRNLGRQYLDYLKDYEVIVKTPGIPIHLPEIETAFKQGKITSQTEIFLQDCPGTVIGVTGTKGKSTTSSIIFDILQKGGKKTHLAGNIGQPMLAFLNQATPENYFVCELSSHQLYNLTVSPHISVILNIYPEHLDYYTGMKEYIRSKANITLHQKESDYLIYNSANPAVNQIAKRSKAQKIAFNEYDWHFSGKTRLLGKFNLENAKIGAIIGRILAIPDAKINQAIADFKPLAHRLELVGNFKGIDCYNDSLSTIQESAVAAISVFGDRLQTLVAGGFDRGQPFDKLARAVLAGKIKSLVLFPTTGERIWHEIETQARSADQASKFAELNPYFVESMPQAAKIILKNTDPGRVCLLSAASASFANFKDYADRGKAFKESLAAAAVRQK